MKSVISKQQTTRRLRPALGQVQDGVHPPLEGSGQATDWPVASEYQAVPAEALNQVIEVGTQVLRAPVLRIDIGQDTGHLAGDDVGEVRQCPDELPPRVHDLLADERKPAVIEDEGDSGALFRQPDGDRQLAIQDAQVEGQTVAASNATFRAKRVDFPTPSGSVCRMRLTPLSFGWPAIWSK